VQQKLMRHAQISTTMNTYSNALMASKRDANEKVVGLALMAANPNKLPPAPDAPRVISA
jgi:integrase